MSTAFLFDNHFLLYQFMQTYFNRYFSTALALIVAYDGKQPLNFYLKKHFSLHKKHGSKDRKWIAHFCYCYYRLGFALQDLQDEEQLLVAVFLCTDKMNDWLALYEENWQKAYTENIDERIRFIQSLYAFNVKDIFYNNGFLNGDIDILSFNRSHLIQPDLFIRIRPQKASVVMDKLQQESIPFTLINDSCLALNNATKIETVIDLNKDAVVQDFSSQQIACLFASIALPERFSVWDCCAASGGKSILAYDYFIDIKLTVSDIRESILSNLKIRFQQAGILHYHSFITDLSAQQFLQKQQYDLVICDAPCSGSGTWSRTPEQLCFFTETKLKSYTQLQERITANAIKAVKKSGYFLYITCSVFTQENEERVKEIQAKSDLKLIQAKSLKGFDHKADTLFAALFINQ